MNRTLSIALLVVGIVLLIIGVNASESFASEMSEFFSGSPTEEAIWFTLIGLVLAIVGGVGLLRRAN